MLELDNVKHSYGTTATLAGVSLTLDEGTIACVLGPSGCGKTTLMRCIAGFEFIEGGSIRLKDKLVASADLQVPPHVRRVGMVFQEYALMPHLTVLQNASFGLHEKLRSEADAIATATLARVGLAKFAERFPHELSGGQQQRVAIARALAPEPALLLMDEPFSNIDASMRADLGQELKELLHGLGTTTLVATHDHNDAFALADKMAVLHEGRLLQFDTAYNVYHRPADRFVAGFVGHSSWLPGTVMSETSTDTEIGVVKGDTGLQSGAQVELLLRPDDLVHDDSSTCQAVITARQFRGSEFLYELQLESGTRVLASVPSHHEHAIGESIGIRLQPVHRVAFPTRI